MDFLHPLPSCTVVPLSMSHFQSSSAKCHSSALVRVFSSASWVGMFALVNPFLVASPLLAVCMQSQALESRPSYPGWPLSVQCMWEVSEYHPDPAAFYGLCWHASVSLWFATKKENICVIQNDSDGALPMQARGVSHFLLVIALHREFCLSHPMSLSPLAGVVRNGCCTVIILSVTHAPAATTTAILGQRTHD